MKKSLMMVVMGVVFGASLLVMCGEDDPDPSYNSNNQIVDMGEDLVVDVDVADEGPDIVEARVTWDSDISTTFKNQCSRCHTWVLNYDLVTGDLHGLRAEMASGHSKLSASQRAMVLAWIDDGAPRNDGPQ